jgi:lipid II:glycine glycyltransferase (peptidoglycan interpeptide bridge formation enzyme)
MDKELYITESADNDCSEWDHFVLNNPQGHRMQTSLWAATKSLTGWTTHYLTARQEGVLIGGAQLYERRYPLVGSLVCLPKGPLCDSSHPELLSTLVTRSRQWAQSHHKFCLLVQPPDKSPFLVEQLLTEKFFKLGDENIVPPGTITVDLQPDADTLFQNLTYAKRKNIRRSQRSGIQVKEGSTQDLDTFYTLYQNTSGYLHFDPVSKERFEGIWRILAPDGYMRLFISHFEEQPLSAMLLLCFGDTATAWRFGWSKEHADKRPNDALYWHTILWAKERGFHYYDFGEIELDAARKLCQDQCIPDEYRDSSVGFKMSFGGKPALNPETYVYFTNAIIRWLYAVFFCKLLDWPLVQNFMSGIG